MFIDFGIKSARAKRLSNSVALPASVKCVDIIAVGRARLIASEGESCDCRFDGLPDNTGSENIYYQGFNSEKTLIPLLKI